jgi:hypothetical protein
MAGMEDIEMASSPDAERRIGVRRRWVLSQRTTGGPTLLMREDQPTPGTYSRAVRHRRVLGADAEPAPRPPAAA